VVTCPPAVMPQLNSAIALSGYGRMNRVSLCYRNECGTVILKLLQADVRQTTTTDRDYSSLNFGPFKVEHLKGSISACFTTSMRKI